MPYFFILPGFFLYVVAMAIAVAGSSVYRPIVPFRPYLVGWFIWSSLGFLVSTIVYVVLMVGAMAAMERFDGGRSSMLLGLMMAGVIFIGPFIAAAGGLLCGGAFGLRRVICRDRSAGRVS